MSEWKRSGDRPLTWAQWSARAECLEATEAVPERLRALWSDLSSDRSPAVTRISKGDREERPELAPAHRPAWVASVYKPRGAGRVLRPRLTHRGIAVDPLTIWQPEDRRVYNDTSYPWGCVCRITSGLGSGSGVLIGPCHVLTASHVVHWGGPSETIEVHRFGGTVQATARVTRRWAFTKLSEMGATTVDEDYAVLVTDQRLGDRFGWMGCRTYDSGWDDENLWWNIGYPDDFGGLVPIFQRDKKLDEDEWDYGSGRAMTTAADAMKGQSGGPMFGFWADGPYVVAVVSAEGVIFASGLENWCSGGNDLTRLVNHARATDP